MKEAKSKTQTPTQVKSTTTDQQPTVLPQKAELESEQAPKPKPKTRPKLILFSVAILILGLIFLSLLSRFINVPVSLKHSQVTPASLPKPSSTPSKQYNHKTLVENNGTYTFTDHTNNYTFNFSLPEGRVAVNCGIEQRGHDALSIVDQDSESIACVATHGDGHMVLIRTNPNNPTCEKENSDPVQIQTDPEIIRCNTRRETNPISFITFKLDNGQHLNIDSLENLSPTTVDQIITSFKNFDPSNSKQLIQTYTIPEIGLTFNYPATATILTNQDLSPEQRTDGTYIIAIPGTDQSFTSIKLYQSDLSPDQWWQDQELPKLEALEEEIKNDPITDSEKPATLKAIASQKQPTTVDGVEALFININSTYQDPRIPREQYLTIFKQNGYIVVAKYGFFVTSATSFEVGQSVLDSFRFSD